ncbi:integrating conjugative element protein [Pseudomonas aeruginosa VRFPA07]|nr:TIGR03752 family integrating conjugative element protein [Pseudomonas aeruginosa]ETD49881.1 integrating conjugative element protein [Pseudomonas aeruginosa VRFPA07]
MALTGNPLLKLLVIPVVIGAILIGVSMMGKKESAQSQGAATPTVTSEEAATLGIDGDTPADTLRTIVAESRQIKDQISKVIQENDSLKAANENLQGRLRNIDQNIEQKLNNTAQELQQQQENRSQTILDQVLGKKESAQSQGAATPTVTSEEAATLGIDGDTPADTLRTIVAESRQIKDQISKVIQENDSLKAANENLQGRLRNIDQNIEQKLNNTAQELQQQQENRSQTILDQVQKRLENLTHIPETGDTDLPVGFGVRPEDGQHFQGAGSSSSDIVWIEPQDARAVDANGQPLAAGSTTQPSGFSFPTSFGNAVDRGQNALERIDDGLHPVGQQRSDLENRKLVRKTYTLPQNSTLMGSVAMSALIGRVPVDGTVNDPYPFKILIGPDNLTANGIELPGVAGAVASGTASGDWTLSCVRGQIRSLTFVFNDGTVRTFPAPAEEVNDNQSNNNQTASADQKTIQGGLGWISDPYGIPCIAGDRRSNAKEYLGNQSLLTAAGAGIAKLLDADENNTSTVFSGNGTSFGTTGTNSNSALNSILSGGVSDIRQWMNKLYGEAFAAVYVQPGARVAVHLDQQLAIDYELKGRKVDYSSGAAHATADLD